MNKVAIIGAGAAGIIAALKASENNHVILIDKNDNCGKKLLVTGNGKCNYWNQNISIENYHTDDIDKLQSILNSKEEVLDYLSSLGIYPYIKGDYYYPYSNSAYSVREIFASELKKRNIELKYNFNVQRIEKDGNNYHIIQSQKFNSIKKACNYWNEQIKIKGEQI